ncbi:MAG: hypothetical protein ACUVWJ_12360 [Spirochaetota bacterium]
MFSIATQMLPTHVQWDSSIGKMERLMRELNIRTDVGGARWSEEGIARVMRRVIQILFVSICLGKSPEKLFIK